MFRLVCYMNCKHIRSIDNNDSLKVKFSLNETKILILSYMFRSVCDKNRGNCEHIRSVEKNDSL